MSAMFQPAFDYLLPHEGGFVDDPTDPGGATDFGISLYWLQSLGIHSDADLNHDGRIDIYDIKALTPALAGGLYQTHWWDYYQMRRLDSQPVASKLFDHMVNMGGIPATRLLQSALNIRNGLVAVDGILGPVTVSAINQADTPSLLADYCMRLCGYYQGLVVWKPTLVKYIKGWTSRANALPPLN